MEDCWDQDAEARLTAQCAEERLTELTLLSTHTAIHNNRYTHCITQQQVHAPQYTTTGTRTAIHNNRYTHCITQQQVHTPQYTTTGTRTALHNNRYTHRNTQQQVHAPQYTTTGTRTAIHNNRYTHRNRQQQVHAPQYTTTGTHTHVCLSHSGICLRGDSLLELAPPLPISRTCRWAWSKISRETHTFHLLSRQPRVEQKAPKKTET